MRWAAQQRMDFIAAQLRESGKINRADLARKYGVSLPQASADFKRFQTEHPGVMRYDGAAKVFVAIASTQSDANGEPSLLTEAAARRRKGIHVGAPACFALELACQHIAASFPGFGCYLVGSALERPDWRDVDVRFIMSDNDFAGLFPDADMNTGNWEFDSRWLLLTVSISAWLSEQSGLPIDFQFQPQTHANERHKGRRNSLGHRIVRKVGE